MGAADTFNIITFAGNTRILWDAPRPATAENIAAAQQFVANLTGGGGTEMMKAINAALVQPASAEGALTPDELLALPTDGREVTLHIAPQMTDVLMQDGIAPSVVAVRSALQPGKSFTMQIRQWMVMRNPYEPTSEVPGEFRGRWTTRDDGTPLFDVGDARWPAPGDEYLTPAELLKLPADGDEVFVRFEYNTWPAKADDAGYAEIAVGDETLLVKREIPRWKLGATCPVGEPLWIWGTWAQRTDGRAVLTPTSARHGQPRPAPSPIRVVCFLTDGYVGNDLEIIDAV